MIAGQYMLKTVRVVDCFRLTDDDSNDVNEKRDLGLMMQVL